MNTESIVSLVIGALLVLGGGYLFYSKIAAFNKAETIISYRKKPLYLSLAGAALLGAGFLLFALAFFLANPSWAAMDVYPKESVFAGEAINYSLYLASALIGAFVFGFAATILVGMVSIRLKKEKMDEATKKFVNVLLYCSIPVTVLSFILGTSGLGPYITYPLISGIGFGEEGVYWLRAGERHSGGLHITWYAICYLLGVALCYVICDHALYKRYHKHGIIDTLVLVAFPAGIVGGRIWYVVGNWNREFAGRPWYSIFEIWNGGLTILGGAAAGIIVGFLFLRFRRKYVDPRWAVDVIVPTILLAQFVGRWGNFFNCEVYGQAVSVSGWSFLPNWLLEQMHVSNSGALLPAGQIYVPLFLIEGVINLVGYFVIAKGLPALFKKKLVGGDLGGAYFVWYGLVRMVMEPMRDSSFNMGTDGAWSVVNSMAYILIGAAIILYLHLHDASVKKEGTLPYAVSFLIFAALPFALLALPSLNIVDGSEIVVYGGYEVIFGGHAPAYLAAFVFLSFSFLLSAAALALSLLYRKGIVSYRVKVDRLALGQAKGTPTSFGLDSLALYADFLVGIIAAILFFAGTSSLGSDYLVGNEAMANLSYGFALSAVFLIAGSLLPLIELWGRYDHNKTLRREAETSVQAL